MNRLLVPVYLNQKLVFDLLAMMQDGISTVTTVSTSQHARDLTENSISGGFGLSEALSMLMKVDLSATTKDSKTHGADESRSEDRVHTPASLLYKLRSTLASKGQLVEDAASSHVYPGQFIEFAATLRRNPAVEVFDSLGELMALSQVFITDRSGSHNKPHKRGEGGKEKQNRASKIIKQIKVLSESIKAGGTIDLIANRAVDNFAVVIPVESKYLNDPNMSDLVDGQFNVLGKVIRRIESNDESISLIRKAAISKMPRANLENMFDAINALGELQGYEIPEIVWEMPGPAFQVIPIAVYA